MRTDERDERLTAELRALGRAVNVAAPDQELIDSVLARVAAEPKPRASGPRARAGRALDWMRARKRAVAAALASVLVALALTPPVRATVTDWFGFGGVIVRERPAPAPSSAPPPPTAELGLSMARARELVRFTPVVPSALGAPDGIEVSADRRVLSMTWDTANGVVRLDEFDGRFSPVLGKFAHRVTRFELDGHPALWFDEPHEVAVVGPDGVMRVESARLAGNTLIWERDGTTLRLEGDLERERAVGIARTARAVR